MAKAKWGAKRICQNCGAKYYDFDKVPVTCPACNTEFDPEAFMRGRRSRVSTSLPAAEIRPETVEAEEGVSDVAVIEPIADGSDSIDDDQSDRDDTNTEVPDDLDLGPEFEDGNDTAADDDSLLDDDELGDDDLPSVEGISDSGDDNTDS